MHTQIPPSKSPLTAKTLTLLVVDDNETNLVLLEEIILRALPGCQVLKAAGAEEGIRLASRHELDGAFIDMQMPHIDGIEMCRRLKAKASTALVPVVLVTAHQSSPELRARALDAGAQDFISQPIRNVEMLARINAVLRVKSLTDRLRSENSALKEQLTEKTRALGWMTGLISSSGIDTCLEESLFLKQISAIRGSDGKISFALFEEEIFPHLPLPLRTPLLKLALLDEIPVNLAEKVSELTNIRSVLDYLERQNFFVSRKGSSSTIYTFHNPLRAFLKTRAFHDLPPGIRGEAYRTAAEWFLEQEEIEKALAHFLWANTIPKAEEIFAHCFPRIFNHGRFDLFLEPLNHIEQGLFKDHPWISLLRGLTAIAFNPLSAPLKLREASTVFERREEREGIFLCKILLLFCHAFIDGNRKEGEECLATIEKDSLMTADGLPENMKQIVALSCAGGQLFLNKDVNRAESYLSSNSILSQPSTSKNLMALFHTMRGYVALHAGRWSSARQEVEYVLALFESSPPTPLAKYLFCAFQADLLKTQGSTFREGLPIFAGTTDPSAEKLADILFEPRRLFWKIETHMAKGALAEALDLATNGLASSTHPTHRERLSNYIFLVSSLIGNTELSTKDREKSSSGSAADTILAATAYASAGNTERAILLLDQAIEQMGRCAERHLLPSALLHRAAVHIGMNNDTMARQDIERGLGLFREHGLRGFCGMTPDLLEKVLLHAQNYGIESPLIESLALERLGLSLGRDLTATPVLKIHALGSLRIELNGQTLIEERDLGAIQRELIETILIRTNLQISQEDVQASFWPDSEAGKARSNFDSLLLRFRKTLEAAMNDDKVKNYITLQRGILALQNCVVDLHAYASLVRRGLRHARRKEFWHADLAFREAHDIWLESGEHGWQKGKEDRYPEPFQLYFEGLLCWSEILMRWGETQEAIKLATEGVQHNPTDDDLVRFLYCIYNRTGNHVKGSQLLRRYRTALETEEFASNEIEEIIRSIVSLPSTFRSVSGS